MTRRAGLALAVLLLAACTLPPLESPTPNAEAGRATATPSISPMPSASATVSTSPSPSPTPDPALVPAFAAGERITTVTDGVRIRSLPGTDRAILVERLATGTELTAVMGPLHVDGFGWYLVADADADAPDFDEGWLAAGYLPDPFLGPVGGAARDPRYVAAFADDGPGEFGPVELADSRYTLRWLALDPDGGGCRLDVSLATGSSGVVPAIRDSSSGSPIRGQLHSTYFEGNPSLIGHVFVTVESDCTWAIGFGRALPDATPSPSPG